MSVCSAMHGNKLYTLQPNLHEQLVEMQVMSLTLPEDIERMKSAKKRDQEQVRLWMYRMCVQAVLVVNSTAAGVWKPVCTCKIRWFHQCFVVGVW